MHLSSEQQQQQEHLLALGSSSMPHRESNPQLTSSPAKPHEAMSLYSNYKAEAPGTVHFTDDRHEHLVADKRLKSRIRRLRLISRTLALILSIAVFVPITMTIHKFLSTQNIYRDVTVPLPGNDLASTTTVSRTAWAKDSKVWPTWMYFAIAACGVLFNGTVLASYCLSIGHANIASMWGTGILFAGHTVVWIVAATVYRTEKDSGGRSNDLWGWVCSPGARAIQSEFLGEVNFGRFCNVQSVSWYFGLVQVGASILTIVIYVMVLMRRESKKRVARLTKQSTGF